MSASGTHDGKPAEDQAANLTDVALESEIELVSELVLAATSSDRPLPQDVVDHLLGVAPAEDSSAPTPGSQATARRRAGA